MAKVEKEPLQALRCDVSERDVANADKAAAKHREAKKAGIQPAQRQQLTLGALAKLRAKKGTDLGVFARNHKLTVTLDEDDEAVAIPGRHGEIVRHPVYGLSLNFEGLSDFWIPRLYELRVSGATVIQVEHTNTDPRIDGYVSFNPADELQVELILEHGGIERTKRGTPESRAAAGERLRVLHAARRAASRIVAPESVSAEMFA
jgi:hypothetical protein